MAESAIVIEEPSDTDSLQGQRKEVSPPTFLMLQQLSRSNDLATRTEQLRQARKSQFGLCVFFSVQVFEALFCCAILAFCSYEIYLWNKFGDYLCEEQLTLWLAVTGIGGTDAKSLP